MTIDTLQARIAAAIRDEAKHYPGDDACADLCVANEDVCMEANIHQVWSVDGVIGSVYSSPERIGVIAAQVIAEYLQKEAVKHWAMGVTLEDSKERHASRILSNIADDIANDVMAKHLAAEATASRDDRCVRGE